ncbi:hypothetical protein HAX54_003030, partial [Datura stramonium]|nr:hypothetical protein [Datura stramonium]
LIATQRPLGCALWSGPHPQSLHPSPHLKTRQCLLSGPKPMVLYWVAHEFALQPIYGVTMEVEGLVAVDPLGCSGLVGATMGSVVVSSVCSRLITREVSTEPVFYLFYLSVNSSFWVLRMYTIMLAVMAVSYRRMGSSRALQHNSVMRLGKGKDVFYIETLFSISRWMILSRFMKDRDMMHATRITFSNFISISF